MASEKLHKLNTKGQLCREFFFDELCDKESLKSPTSSVLNLHVCYLTNQQSVRVRKGRVFICIPKYFVCCSEKSY